MANMNKSSPNLYDSPEFRFLRYCKILPEQGQEDSPRYLIMINVIFGAVWSLCFCAFNYIYHGLKRHLELDDIKFAIVCLVSLAGVMWINVFCVKNRHFLISLTKCVTDFQIFGKPPGFEEFHRRMILISKLYLCFIIAVSLAYFAFCAPVHRQSCKVMNKAKNLKEPCTLLVPIKVPFLESQHLESFPIIYLVNITIFFTLIYMYLVCATVFWLNVALVEYIRIRIRHVKYLMLKALRNSDAEIRRAAFQHALKYHVAVYRMGCLADRFFGAEFFLHVILTGAILGVSAFSMIRGGTLESLIIFFAWFAALIMGSFAGQRLINESSTIPDVLYKVNWYNFDSKLKKDLIFFLLGSKKPLQIRAGYVVMTNVLLIQTLRTAYSYITFLTSIAED